MIANPVYRPTKRSWTSLSTLVLLGTVVFLTLVVGAICAWLMLQTVASYYAARIYPNVYVLGMKLGQMSPTEAAALLGGASLQTDTGALALTDGNDQWWVSWSEVGLHLDVTATVQAAYAVGHTPGQSWLDQIRAWLSRRDVAPIFAVDEGQARQVLERLASTVAVLPTDAELRLENGQAVVAPGRPGRALDVEATLAQLLALNGGRGATDKVRLLFRTIAPAITDVSAAQRQAEELLARRIELSAYDVLTDETLRWTLDQDDVMNWLRITSTSSGPTVSVEREAVAVTLAGLAAELGDGRGLRLSEAATQVLNVFEAGGGTVALYLTHPDRAYTVQPGDTLSGIGAAFGMPSWLILQANPNLDPDWLRVGQELVIPSQDLLTPHMPVPGKRVVVSIAEQRLRAYANGALVFD
jgi:LysM repeat protein